MTSRIKGVLGSLVDENQIAFIGGRQITDNILLAQELFKGYNRKQNSKKVSFKTDLQKAYDTNSWEFIKEALEMFGFHKTMDSESVKVIKKSLDEFSRKHIWWKLGNEKSVNVWHDRWCPVRPLSDFIDTRDIYDARLSNKWTVSEIIHEGRWKWPADWSTEFVELGQIQLPTLNDEIKDAVVWISGNGHEKKFKISNVWEDMNCNEIKADWYPLVWFKQSIPRHAFVTWLVVQKRLMTQDKIMI
ncbi:RNA-directed DNA polymerase, eukaryota, reverse transcriptase zinc-binding domain protein [Tanacetum coccineum]